MACCRHGKGQFCRSFFQTLLSLLITTMIPVKAATLPTPATTLQQNLALHYQQENSPIEVIQLMAEGEPFLGLFYDQLTAAPQGAVLILHDLGTSADWPYLQRQLHRFLPQVGWSTLAVSLPSPRAALNEIRTEQGVSYIAETPEQWQARMNAHIESAIANLNSRGFFNIAVVAIGDSVYQAAAYFNERIDPLEEESYALVMINAPYRYQDLPGLVGSLSISTLDLYMTDSNLAHQQAALRKAAAAKAQHPDYLLINDAPRQGFYSIPAIDRTTRRVWGWLRHHAAGLEAQLAD